MEEVKKDGIITVKSNYVVKSNHDRNLEILKPVYDVMQGCYGPHAGMTLIDGTSTKDGVSILMAITARDNEIAPMLLNTLRRSAARNDLRGGDGTTSTTMLAIALYKKCVELGIKKIKPDIFNKIVSDIEKLKEREVTREDVLNVAHIALNNEEDKSRVIREIYDALDAENDENFNWRNVDFIPRIKNDVKKDKVTFEILNGAVFFSTTRYKVGKTYDRAKCLYIEHPVDSSIHILRVRELINLFRNIPNPDNAPFVIIAPKISDFAFEHIKGYVQAIETERKTSLNFDMIEAIHPSAKHSMEASYDLSISLCLPVIRLENIPDTSDGVVDSIIPNEPNNVLAQRYFASALHNAPRLTITPRSEGTNVTVIDAHPVMREVKEDAIKTLRESMRLARSNDREAIAMRINTMVQKDVILNISAATDDVLRSTYDMYRDACLHIQYARTGVIGGANIGMIRALRSVCDRDTLTIPEISTVLAIAEAYETLLQSLIMNMSGNDGVMTVDPSHIINSIMGAVNIADAHNTPGGFDCTLSYDLLTDTVTNKVLSAINNEVNILKTSVDIANSWLGTNQISFKHEENALEYVGNVIAYE